MHPGAPRPRVWGRRVFEWGKGRHVGREGSIMMRPRRPEMKAFRISPAVSNEMAGRKEPIPVIISLLESSEAPQEGIRPSKEKVKAFLAGRGIVVRESDFYVFASLRPEDIEELAELEDAVDKIWRDDTCHAHLLSSAETVKATACWRTFGCRGSGITWAVLDTGIRSDHPHFKTNNNINKQLSKNFSNSRIRWRTAKATARTWQASSAAPPRPTASTKPPPWRRTATNRSPSISMGRPRASPHRRL